VGPLKLGGDNYGMRKLLLLVLILSVAALSTVQVFAVGEATSTVKATVATELISINTNISTLDYGIVTAGTSILLPKEDAIIVTNSGNVAEVVEVVGSNAHHPRTTEFGWNLVTGDIEGVNEFKHYITVPGGSKTSLSAVNYSLVSDNLAAGGSISGIDTELVTPWAGSNFGSFETYITFRATKK